ncbi:hypothetical protein [Paenibacillus campi]|uniref:hypothetical protein n=1 Tax=Paenibacillus campi TaxID=3106031 RepID=UPI002AFFA4BE|nr:hypothetical protein [Paenibacillus sp. SGZ-1014]
MRKIISFLLILVLFIISCPPTFANDNTNNEFTKEDVLTLKPYVSVNANGFFELNDVKAKQDGIDVSLLEGQKTYFDELNQQIRSGNLKAHSDLSITSNNQTPLISNLNKSATSSCTGINTAVKNYWWGYSRYMDSCVANKFAADLTSGGISVVAAYFGVLPAVPPGITASYFGLLASRVAANNANSTGIYLEMTWALAFNITPQ